MKKNQKKTSILLLSMLCILVAGCDSSSSSSNSQLETSNTQVSEISDNKTLVEEKNVVEAVVEEVVEEVAHEITYKNASTYKNSIGTVWLNTIYEVTNTGSVPLYLSSASCDIENEDGKLVKSLSMVSVYPNVIDVGEKAYYYESTTLSDETEAIDVVPLPRVKIDKAKVPTTRLEVSEVEIFDDTYGGIKARGRVENTTDEEQSMVYIAMTLFDEDDNPAHVIFTILMEDFAVDDKIGFELSSLSMPSDFTANNVSRYEICAYPMQMQF